MILSGLYDSTNKRLVVNFTSNLLKDHYQILEKVVGKNKKSGHLRKDLELQKIEDSKCLIIIPIDIPGTEKLSDGERLPGIPKDLLEEISDLIDNFKVSALREELGTTEFIPLYEYPVENLKTDVLEAIRNKRNFCIIDKYSEYKKFSNRETSCLRQHKVMYPTNEYSEIALYIHEGDMSSLREIYIPKLKKVDWEE